MNLIDKDALKKDVLDLPNCYNGFSDAYDKSCIIGVIDEQPTIEERKKGEWIPKDDGRYHCSSCDGIAPKGYRWDFCPICGSVNRGDGDA